MTGRLVDEPTSLNVPAGTSARAMLLYGRWWQLETWLRELVYLELRASFGSAWREHLGPRTPSRARVDAHNAYMASPDSQHLVAYLDASDLFSLTLSDELWPLFAPTLPPRVRWAGTVDALLPIRHRVAHCRRPHTDDIRRVEQVLRDLELGAQGAWRSYVDTEIPDRKARDPVVRGWIGRRHDDADRLVEHARRQYDTSFSLSYSVRPWAKRPAGQAPITGRRGQLWRARWVTRAGFVDPAELWASVREDPGVNELLVHLLMMNCSHVEATFSAVDDGGQVADAIGRVFDAVLTVHQPAERVSDDRWEKWPGATEDLDPRVHVDDLLANFDTYNDFRVFDA